MVSRASVAAFLATLVLASVLSAACAGNDEELAPASPTSSPVATAAPTTAATDTPGPPTASPGTPADWLTFTSRDGLFSLRYPPSWFVEVPPTPPPSPQPLGWGVGYLFSIDPATVTGPAFPADGAKVDLEVSLPTPGYDCRVQPTDATAAALGGVPGWRVTQPIAEQPGFIATAVRAFARGYCFKISGYFGSNNHDQGTFDDIVRSWAFVGATQ